MLPVDAYVLKRNLQDKCVDSAAHLSLCRFEEKRCTPMQMSEVDPELDKVYRKCTGGPSWSTVPIGSGEVWDGRGAGSHHGACAIEFLARRGAGMQQHCIPHTSWVLQGEGQIHCLDICASSVLLLSSCDALTSLCPCCLTSLQPKVASCAHPRPRPPSS